MATHEEAVAILKEGQEKLGKAETKRETLNVLAEAGKKLGYKPVFRALVLGENPESAVRW